MTYVGEDTPYIRLVKPFLQHKKVRQHDSLVSANDQASESGSRLLGSRRDSHSTSV